jgi:hypothetical protein
MVAVLMRIELTQRFLIWKTGKQEKEVLMGIIHWFAPDFLLSDSMFLLIYRLAVRGGGILGFGPHEYSEAKTS